MTNTITSLAPQDFALSPGRRADSSIDAAWELALGEDRARAEAARIVELTNALRQAQYGQITSGDDPRLETFWEKAGRIADYAGYCDEYDRMAEALDGPRRSRDYDVEVEVTVNVRVTMTVSAESENEACDLACDSLDEDAVKEAITSNGVNDWSVDDTTAERA